MISMNYPVKYDICGQQIWLTVKAHSKNQATVLGKWKARANYKYGWTFLEVGMPYGDHVHYVAYEGDRMGHEAARLHVLCQEIAEIAAEKSIESGNRCLPNITRIVQYVDNLESPQEQELAPMDVARFNGDMERLYEQYMQPQASDYEEHNTMNRAQQGIYAR